MSFDSHAQSTNDKGKEVQLRHHVIQRHLVHLPLYDPLISETYTRRPFPNIPTLTHEFPSLFPVPS